MGNSRSHKNEKSKSKLEKEPFSKYHLSEADLKYTLPVTKKIKKAVPKYNKVKGASGGSGSY